MTDVPDIVMEYLARRFENTAQGLKEKEAYAAQLTADDYRIISEQVEPDGRTTKQGLASLFSLPVFLLAGEAPGTTLVTYGRDTLFCAWCGHAIAVSDGHCPTCQGELTEHRLTNRKFARRIVERKLEAANRNTEIDRFIDQLSNVLADSMQQDHHFDWNLLRIEFTRPQPHPPAPYQELPKPAGVLLSELCPLLEKLLPGLRRQRLAWGQAREAHRAQNEIVSAQHQREIDEWRSLRNAFEQKQNAQIEAKARLCRNKDVKSLLQYWQLVLDTSKYPDGFPRSYTLDYSAENQRLTIDFHLPPIAYLPKIGEVKYHPGRNTFEEVPVSDNWLKESHEELAVKVALRTVYELFQSDSFNALNSVAFNGRIQPLYVLTDQELTTLVLSLEVSKADYPSIQLAKNDAMVTFKRLKGLLSENLSLGLPIKAVRTPESAPEQNLAKNVA